MGLLDHIIKTAEGEPVVEVAHHFHPVVVEPPQVVRKEHPFTGFIDFQGLKIDVENRAGSERKGVDKDGHAWAIKMRAGHYGEIRDTLGTDGDNLDVYVGPNHDSSLVVVIRQHKPDTGAYDEDKVMVGYDSVEEAIGAYKKQYDKPGFYKDGDYVAMPIGKFWRWVHDERQHGKKVAAVQLPDVLRAAVPLQKTEFGLHPTARKALYGLAAAGVAGAVGKKVLDAHREEEETGIPSKLKNGALYGLGAAAVGAGLGYGGAKVFAHYAPRVQRMAQPSAQLVVQLVEDMRKAGVPAHTIAQRLKTTPGVREHLEAALVGSRVKQAVEHARWALPAAGALYLGSLGARAGSAGATRHKERVVELANALHDNPPSSNDRIKAPSDDLFLHPAMTDALRERAWQRYGEHRAGEKDPSWLTRVGGSALAGGAVGAVHSLRYALATNRLAPTKRALLTAIRRPLALSVGAGVLAGAGLGALSRMADARDIKDWRSAKQQGPEGIASRANEEMEAQRSWLEGTELSKSEKRRAAGTLARAEKFNAFRGNGEGKLASLSPSLQRLAAPNAFVPRRSTPVPPPPAIPHEALGPSNLSPQHAWAANAQHFSAGGGMGKAAPASSGTPVMVHHEPTFSTTSPMTSGPTLRAPVPTGAPASPGTAHAPKLTPKAIEHVHLRARADDTWQGTAAVRPAPASARAR